MGWGLLFLGYVCTFIIGMNPMFFVFLALPGWTLMALGLRTLSRYCHAFRYPLWCALFALPLYAWQTLCGVQSQLHVTVPLLNDTVSTVVDWTAMLTVLLFHTLLALAIRQIAQRVSLPKNAVRAMRNMVLLWLYGVTFLVMNLSGNDTLTVTLYPIVTLLHLLWAILFAVLLYSCYMRICPAEDDRREAPPKPLGVAWIDKLRRTSWEKEQRAVEADRAYHAQNAQKKREEQLARMSRKQRERQERKGK